MTDRVRGAWEDAESSDENSAPDFDKLTYIEPSIYNLPQGDVDMPHRPGAEWGKEVVESLGFNAKAQTTLDMDKELAIDAHEEAKYLLLDRETLIQHLRHLYKKLEMRWASTYPRYRSFLAREIKRLETIIPVSRPAEIPVHEWLPPDECRRILRHGPRELQTPPDVPANVTERFRDAQQALQKLVSAQDEVAVRHYLRLMSEGRLPPPSAAEEEALRDETDLQREERLHVAQQERVMEMAQLEAEEERCRRKALTDMMVPEAVWNSLLSNGYNGTEALAVMSWVDELTALDKQGEIKWEALCVPGGMRNRWEGVDTAALDVPAGAHPRLQNMALRAHWERIHLSNSSYNTEPFVEGVVMHPFVYRGDGLAARDSAGDRVQNDGSKRGKAAGQAVTGLWGSPEAGALPGLNGGVMGYVDAKVLGEDVVDAVEEELGQGASLASGVGEQDQKALSALVDWIKHGDTWS